VIFLTILAYISPEVLNTSHAEYSGKLSDSWSLGIVLYTLLLGRYPFHHPTIATMFAKIARAKFQIPPSSGLSLDAKLLLRSLIRPKPSERLLPSEILSHNWLKANFTDLSQLHQNKFKSLNSAYSYLNHLSGSFQMSPISNQYIHKPLGISRSSPAGSLMMGHNPIGNEPNINNNNSITNKFLLPPKTSLGVNSNQNESEDCTVPEFIQTN
jgi:serine/threonine protein kinase